MRLVFIAVLLFMVRSTLAQPVHSDPKASRKTKILYQNLSEIASKGVMFGHQDDLSYGTDWWAVEGASDVNHLVGSYPAIYGWDLGGLHMDRNLDSVAYEDIRRWIVDAYKMGGINTISWHTFHPQGLKSSWDKSAKVSDLLPGGETHDQYIDLLDKLADFISSCKTGLSTQIPIVFRPFHEQNGDWFWWGKDNCTEQEYISLWRFTMDYLREQRKLHNLIVAFSPDRSRLDLVNGVGNYMYGYPGDDYVDVIGLDDYWDTGHTHNTASPAEQLENLQKSVELIDKIAKEKNKIAALTETGKAGQEIDHWYDSLLKGLDGTEGGVNISWVLVWRNASREYFYVPYKGHRNEQDFKEFYASQKTIFQNNLNNPYTKKPLK